MAAIEQLRSEDNALAKKMKLHTYIVHRGDWPCPKGYHPNVPLAPPYGLARSDTKWYSLALSQETADLKRKAIRKYKTQTAVERGFMMSFARNNEILGDLPDRTIAIVKPNTIHIDGNLDDWSRVPPVVVDPVDDYVMAGINRGGDVRAIYLCSDETNLYARIDCTRHLSKRINYTINIRGLNLHDTDDCYTISVRPGRTSPGAVWAWNDNILEISIPLKKLNFDREIFVQVQTKMMKLTVDNTGWHGIDFNQQKMAEGKKPKA
jgi:N-acetyl-1-D-myo-inositol-2-amino-2-deoxy-alpha-D-glucopyranoside deacetylase